MAKELPYFQFEPAEYLTKDVSFCSLASQGFFINLCAYYWQRECKLTTNQLLKRLNYPNELNELITEKVITVIENVISVNFLDAQYKKATNKNKVNRINGSKGGRPKKINPKKTERLLNKNPIESESKGIREDKIKEDKIKEDKISSLEEPKRLIFTDWIKYRKSIKKEIKINSTFDRLIERFKKESLDKCNQVVNNSIENGYTGLFWENYKPTQKKQSDKPTDNYVF